MKSGDIRLGQHLIQKRACTLRQINEGLQEQKELRGQGNVKPLGSILLQRGFLAEEDLREALAELGALELSCKACRESHAIAAYQRGVEYRCPRCRNLLTLDDPPASVELALRGPSPAALPPDANAVDAPPADDPMLLKVIGGCQIIQRIAKGGMGVVYKARQLNLGRTVAIKILSEDLSRDRTYVDRFIQEARSAAGLNHPNIIHINDVGEHSGIYFFIMEYVDGENLREVLQKEGQLEVARALQILIQVAQALQHAHRRGIVHRDIKPENIMITREGGLKLADLGLAKRLDIGSGITHVGSILGTPFYMAPEQAKDFSQVDQRSDIYSLGVTLYRTLTGRVPYDGRSPIEVMIKAIEGRRNPIRSFRSDIPGEVEAMVDRMMERDPAQRFQDAEALIAAAEKCLGVLEGARGAEAVPSGAGGLNNV